MMTAARCLVEACTGCLLQRIVRGHDCFLLETENVFNCSRHQHCCLLLLGTVYKFSYLLTYLFICLLCWLADDADGNVSRVQHEGRQGEERRRGSETLAGQGQDGAG